MTRSSKIVWFGVLAFGILFLDSAAVAQQSQSWKFPLSIPTTQSGYPSPVVASTGPLAVGTYSITAKTSLQNLYSAREPSGKCYLVLLDANGNVIPDSQPVSEVIDLLQNQPKAPPGSTVQQIAEYFGPTDKMQSISFTPVRIIPCSAGLSGGTTTSVKSGWDLAKNTAF